MPEGPLSGRFICVIGIDGSGKTTLAQGLACRLQKCGYPSEYVYARFVPQISRIFIWGAHVLFLKGDHRSEGYTEFTEQKKNTVTRHPWASRVYRNLLLVEYLFQLLIKVRLPLLRGKTVVCDRYIFDTAVTDFAVDMHLSELEVDTLIRRCLRLVPTPDLMFYVDVDVETAWKRKNDIPSRQYLLDRKTLYSCIAHRYSMAILNGNASPDTVLDECYQRVQHAFHL